MDNDHALVTASELEAQGVLQKAPAGYNGSAFTWGVALREPDNVRSSAIVVTMEHGREISFRKQALRLSMYGLALFLVIYLVYPFLPDIVARWTAPQTWQPSLNVAFHLDPLVAPPLCFSLIACIIYSFRTLWHRDCRDRLYWITIRVSIVAVMVVLVLSTFTTISDGRKILDGKVLEGLEPLRVGLSRHAVDSIILRSNMMILAHREKTDEGQGIEDLMKHRLQRAEHGEYGMLEFEKVVPYGLFYQVGSGGQREEHLERDYHMTDARTRYTLNLHFDVHDRLVSADYKRQWYGDGSIADCEVLFERPATQPGPCDPSRIDRI